MALKGKMKEIKDPISVVDADGVIIVAVGFGSEKDVVLRCDDENLLALVRRAADWKNEVEIIHGVKRFEAGWETPIAVLAALMSAVPGRSRILETTPEITRTLNRLASPAGVDNRYVVY